MSKTIQKYESRADAVNSLLCVGLDSSFDRLPARFKSAALPQFAFNRWIIEQTHPYTSAYKPNAAFYEARGEEGMRALEQTMVYLQSHHPDILTVYDAKRGDIGSTSEAYAAAVFGRLGFDAVTLSPYLGEEALTPFLTRADKGCVILCRTSNPGAGELQDLAIDGKPLWQVVAEQVSGRWNRIVGAHPDDCGPYDAAGAGRRRAGRGRRANCSRRPQRRRHGDDCQLVARSHLCRRPCRSCALAARCDQPIPPPLNLGCVVQPVR
jgi:orotidine 5'-phosphate decarboxylase subfamily 2